MLSPEALYVYVGISHLPIKYWFVLIQMAFGLFFSERKKKKNEIELLLLYGNFKQVFVKIRHLNRHSTCQITI